MTENSSIAARFEIRYRQNLTHDGLLTDRLPEFAKNTEDLRALYRAMVSTRIFDERAIALQRTGRIGTYASSLGQEAVGVGTAAAMREGDVLLPSFREHGAQLWRGVTMTEILLFWGGDERGSDFTGPRYDFPVCVPVGDQYPHAAGVALAMQFQDQPFCAVAIGGDGSTSKGDFYEALNLGGVWRLPIVFVVNNNQWAISVRRADQTAAETIAQKALAGGLHGEQVDGCDVIAVRAAVSEAIERAVGGQGPSLIECITYRICDHTTADDASRYRNDDEVSAAWAYEPIRRLRDYLVKAHGWSKNDEKAVRLEARAEVDAATEAYLAVPAMPAEAMFEHLYAEPTWDTQRDLATLQATQWLS